MDAVCLGCGRAVGAGTTLFGDRRRLPDGGFRCGDCTEAERTPPALRRTRPATHDSAALEGVAIGAGLRFAAIP